MIDIKTDFKVEYITYDSVIVSYLIKKIAIQFDRVDLKTFYKLIDVKQERLSGSQNDGINE